MHPKRSLVCLVGLIVLLSSVCYGSTITGTVVGPDGAPFQGAFVEAENTKTRMTVAVLSNTQGHYQIEKLPAGQYRLLIRAVGYRTDPRLGVSLTADQHTSFDFALQKGVVRWNEISFYQAMQLWPAGKGKQLILADCSICHLFQTRMASVTRDADGWRDRVEYMRTAMHYNLPHLTDQDAGDVASYLTSLFGPESVLPKSPEDMPKYKDTVRPFSSDALNIVYVEYDMPGPSRMPFSAAPDKNGYVWIPNFGVANKITRLDPKTGEMQDFPVPNIGTAAIHSAVPAPDGSVWLAEQGSNKLGRWDPDTQKITEYQDQYTPGKEGIGEGGEKHTVRLDPSGNVWASGVPLTKFDPETRKFTRFEEVNHAYDVKPDKNGDVWFTSRSPLNKIGKVDGKTMKVTMYTPTTPNCYPRRLEIASDGVIWFGEFNAGKMGRFDPKTETFTEYPLPGPDPTPYALGIDSSGYIWYDSHHMDVIGRFDPKTGHVTEYPFPQSELSMREFFRDSQGRMWFGTNPNNKVGYFYLTTKSDGTESASR
ncbi:MAG: carboxypeptidase regulatory-like domain-containing protein [Candidatus Acidiferrales bacterium]|jgi:virginiamycin B lyase